MNSTTQTVPNEARWLPATGARVLHALPFTTRGLLFLSLGLFLVLIPARNDNDMVASVIGYSLIALVLGFASATLIQARSIQRNLQVRFNADSFSPEAATPTAGLLTRVVVRLSPFNVFPFTTVETELSFNSALPCAQHTLVGSTSDDRILVEDIRFPHRGIWQVQHYQFRTGDLAGLSSIAWRDHESARTARVDVLPAQHPERNLPVMTSAVRSGDAVSDLLERQGDLFDLKQYHPSDGMKRVLWKVFAKRGELISRHPERAVSPEGQVVCFVIANKHEDAVCAEAVHFSRMIEELDLELWCGCEGRRERSITRSSQNFLRLLVESVWDASTDAHSAEYPSSSNSLQIELATLLSTIRSSVQDSRIDKVVVFLSERRAGAPELSQHIVAALDSLSKDGTQPVLVISKGSGIFHSRSGATPRLSSLFIHKTEASQGADPAAYKKFLGLCAQRGWEVIL